MTKEELQYKKMIETPTRKLVIKLGIPTIISMLVTALYNLADTFFVSHLDTSASGAVGVVFPLMAIIQAIGFTFGMGSGSMISSKLGEKKEDDAQKIGSSGFYTAICLGIIISIIMFIFLNPLLTNVLGATETVLPYARDYAIYIIFGFPIMIGSFVLNNILRAEGKSKLAMIGLTTGGFLNIGLDPLLIYTFKMGISGAAVATLLSQSVSFIILLSMFLTRKSIIKLSPKFITADFGVYSDIIKVGFPSLCRQGLASIATILLNNQAATYGGDPALSAMSIVSKIFTIIFSVSLGIGQGYQPVAGYNYFAKRYDRVKEAMIFTFIIGMVLMTCFAVVFFIFAETVVSFFIDDVNVINIGKVALRFQCVSIPFISLNVISNMTFQSLRKKKSAALLSCCRQGIFFIPLSFILPAIFELLGVEMIQAASDICTFLFTLPFFLYFLKEINKKIEEQRKEEKRIKEMEFAF